MTDLNVGKKTSVDGKLNIFATFERTGSKCYQLDGPKDLENDELQTSKVIKI